MKCIKKNTSVHCVLKKRENGTAKHALDEFRYLLGDLDTSRVIKIYYENASINVAGIPMSQVILGQLSWQVAREEQTQ